MTARVALLALALLALGCGSSHPNPCAPSTATHRLICVGIGNFDVYMDGGRICHYYGGEIRIRGAECVLVPIQPK